MSKIFLSNLRAGITTIFILAFLVSTSTAAEHATKISPQVPPELTIGKLLYGKFCSSCHGVDLKGAEQGPPFLHRIYHPDHHGDGSFFLAAKRGVRAHHWKFGNMPPVKGVDDKIVNEIIRYVRQVRKSSGLF